MIMSSAYLSFPFLCFFHDFSMEFPAQSSAIEYSGAVGSFFLTQKDTSAVIPCACLDIQLFLFLAFYLEIKAQWRNAVPEC